MRLDGARDQPARAAHQLGLGRVVRHDGRCAQARRAEHPHQPQREQDERASSAAAGHDRSAPDRSSPTGPGEDRRTTPRLAARHACSRCWRATRALSALPSARLVNNVPPATSSDAPRADLLLEQRAFAIRRARERQHEVVVRHAQRPFRRLRSRFRARVSSRPASSACGPVAVERDLLRNVEQLGIRSRPSPPPSRHRHPFPAHRARPPRARVATAACCRGVPRAPRASRIRWRSAIRFRRRRPMRAARPIPADRAAPR